MRFFPFFSLGLSSPPSHTHTSCVPPLASLPPPPVPPLLPPLPFRQDDSQPLYEHAPRGSLSRERINAGAMGKDCTEERVPDDEEVRLLHLGTIGAAVFPWMQRLPHLSPQHMHTRIRVRARTRALTQTQTHTHTHIFSFRLQDILRRKIMGEGFWSRIGQRKLLTKDGVAVTLTKVRTVSYVSPSYRISISIQLCCPIDYSSVLIPTSVIDGDPKPVSFLHCIVPHSS